MNNFKLSVIGENEIHGSWGEFSYLRIFSVSGKRNKKSGVNGWIVQSIERNINVFGVNGQVYNTDNDIRRLTDDNVKFSVGNYVEFFRVKNGQIVDSDDDTQIVDDRFQGGQVKRYQNGETTINEEDDTGGKITMRSNAYFVENTVNGEDIDKIIRSIDENVGAANGLISSYGHDNYYNLMNYRSSNIWCGNIEVEWEIPSEMTSDEEAGSNRFINSEQNCNINMGGKKRLKKTKKKRLSNDSYSMAQLKLLAKKLNVTTSGTKKEVATRILKMRGFLPAQNKQGLTKLQRKTLKNSCKC